MSLLSCSLSGQAFSTDHHILLRVVARSRQWKGNVWVPEKTVERLNFPLCPDTAPPVRLTASNGDSFVYHAAQFTAPLAALQEAWRDYVSSQECLPTATSATGRGALLATLPSLAPPLSTNGERFDPETEERMVRWRCTHSEGSPLAWSAYWATAAEAEFIYRAPFHETFLADPSNAVFTGAFSLCRPIALYNVVGTIDPSRFSSETCRRYDPVNYKGSFYKPCVAVSMKAYALRHNCLHERQWITVARAARIGLSVPRSVTALAFHFSTPVNLVNAAQTRRSPILRGRVIGANAAVPDGDVAEEHEDELLSRSVSDLSTEDEEDVEAVAFPESLV